MGDVLVRPLAATLEIGGEARRVDFKAMQVLVCLARRAGNRVTKKELFDTVWSSQAVSDDVLTGAISTLRKALDDDPRDPRFIQTIPRVGYRLIAEVRSPGSSSDRENDPEIRLKEARPWPRLILGALAVVVLIAGAARFSLHHRDPTAIPDGPLAIHSLAVLPLRNLTGDATQAHLADGTMEALIAGLAQENDLKVISRTSSVLYESDQRRLPEIGRELGVEALVEGSVQRSGNAVRITVQLIDAHRDEHLWAGSFDDTIANILALQSEVATTIRAQIRALSPGKDGEDAGRAAAAALPVDPEAYDAFLRGRYLLNKGDEASIAQALAELERSIAAEPEFLTAHTSRAEAWIVVADRANGSGAGRTAFEEARRSARRALAIDPASPRAQTLLAIIDFAHDWSFASAAERFEKALRGDPSDVLGRLWYARFLTACNRPDEALAEVRRLRELDPLAYSRPEVAWLYYLNRRPELALAEIRSQLAVDSSSSELHMFLAGTHLRLAQPDEAIASYLEALRLDDAPLEEVAAVEKRFADEGLMGVYRLAAEELREREQSGERVPATHWAEVLIGLGDLDGGFAKLEQAVADREIWILLLAVDPMFDAMRNDRRYRALLQQIGLPA